MFAPWNFLLYISGLLAIELDINSDDSIKSAASSVARGLMNWYKPKEAGNVVGKFGHPYYWWQAGAAWGLMVDYWYLTGDSQYNELVKEAILSQTGPKNDFMPTTEMMTEGNDDQAFWALVTAAAFERKYPDPPPSQPQWLALTQAVFNSQAARWDMEHCGGGLRWQIYSWNNGWTYKNAVSTGCFFQIAARLARYTENQTYNEWADRIWDWTTQIGLISSPEYKVFDGLDIKNCASINHIQWSYNAGTYLIGAAYMWNITRDPKWRERSQRLMDGLSVFFAPPGGILYEAACEPSKQCNVDQRSFKGYLARFMAYSAQMAPFLYAGIHEALATSAKAAALTCTGGEDQLQCGHSWLQGSFDGDIALGNQMSALEVIQSLLAKENNVPVTKSTGGTSKGDPGAGTSSNRNRISPPKGPTHAADRVKAGFLTVFILSLLFLGAYFLVS